MAQQAAKRSDIIPKPKRGRRDDRDDDASAANKPYREPANLEEAVERLNQQRAVLAEKGLDAARPRYSDAELTEMAKRAETQGLGDRFIVRLTERRHAGDSDNIGPVDANGNAKYWTAPLKTVEPGDTDPRALASLLGKDNYDPNADYSVAIVDLEKSNLREEANTFVPTFNNMADFAKKELTDYDPKRIDEVMTQDYAKHYTAPREAMDRKGYDVHDSRQVKEFADAYFDETDARERFKARAAIESQLGANARFMGDGRTEYLGDGQTAGALETYTFDRKPRTYENLTGVQRLDAEPVNGD